MSRRTQRPALFPYTTLFRSPGRGSWFERPRTTGGGHLPPGVRAIGDLAIIAAIAYQAWSGLRAGLVIDPKSTRLNSSHLVTSYAVFCLKRKILAEAYRPVKA